MKKNLGDMMCLDIYLSSLSKAELEKVKKDIKPPKRLAPPLMCWEFYYPKYQQNLKEAERETELKTLHKYSGKFNWKTDLKKVLKTYPYKALILTNETKRILWVNDGFSEMTGYPKSYAINRSPIFLQGENTSEAVKLRINEKIEQNKPFKEVVVNYRKNGEMYNCEIQIFPLTGNNNSIHFLALEREVA
ncbi:PAS domain S-box-containing protein [Draconibacterium orientale]|jgi:PAS domain S-box-containing protein|uniref:Diguanylate cyclase n=1 Tax=Draconibacterium orientale TaxID=1168034 RepID=X5DGE1_9BACT|nr:PAS domain-containing protein [Draconibacterium orientale]AHW59507.1 diguanylate cyclase [Draconibacterium orientale]SES90006.1 PAS domain S-box-containing protein [Draconibacterium orientale]